MGRIIVLMALALSIAMLAAGSIVYQVEAAPAQMCITWRMLLQAATQVAIERHMLIPWIYEPVDQANARAATLTLVLFDMEARLVYHFTAAGCLERTETLPLAEVRVPRGEPA